MTFDQLARERAAAVRRRLDTITIPEPCSVVRRARRRRVVLATAVVLVVGAIATPIAVSVAGRDAPKTLHVGANMKGLPAGASREGPWTMIPKQSAGLAFAKVPGLFLDDWY